MDTIQTRRFDRSDPAAPGRFRQKILEAGGQVYTTYAYPSSDNPGEWGIFVEWSLPGDGKGNSAPQLGIGPDVAEGAS